MTNSAAIERASIFLLCACVILVFGFGAPSLGFYYEDSGFMTSLPSANLSTLWGLFAHGSVPGRNLYIVWQALLYKLVGNPATHLMALHLIQSFIDSVIVAVLFVVLRRLGASAASSFVATGLFAFWPIHGETHYWTPGTPYNLSTLFLLLFILTSICLLERPRPAIWLWILDALVFGSALFTYDQLVIFIALLLLVRLSVLIVRSPRHALAILAGHLFNLSLCFVYLLQKAKPADGPALTGQTWANFWPNIHQILLQNFGRGWLEAGRPLYERATGLDMCLSLVAAAVVTAISIAALSDVGVAPARSLRLFVAGLAFFVLTYIPVALWYLSRRHNFLPSIGLFACVAAVVDLFFSATGRKALKALPVVAAGVAVVFFADIGRGESRYWENAFAAKRQLYADLAEDIKGKEILVLEGFPVLSGPAEVILPHDAVFGPRLVYKKGDIASFRTGDVGSSPAHEGIFLNTQARFYRAESISYYETNRILIVNFIKWLPNNRFSYRISSRSDDPTYRILDSAVSAYSGPFAVESAAIAPAGGNAVLSLDIRSGLPASSHLVMTFSVQGSSGLVEWGRKTPEGFLNRSPVLLESSESKEVVTQLDHGPEPEHGIRFRGRVLLYAFPDSERVQIHFLAMGEHGVVGHLGDWDVPIDLPRQ